MNISRPNGDYAVRITDDYVIYESGSYDCILPQATGSGRQVTIINYGTGEISVRPQSLETLHRDTEKVLSQYDTMILIDLEWQKWVII